MTPELVGILAVGMTLAGLMIAIWRDARAHTNQGLAELRTEVRDVRTEVRDLRTENRTDFAQIHADFQSHREEVRADNQSLWEELRADFQSHREEVRADMQIFRQEVRADLAEVNSNVGGLRKDVQALTERTSRVEGVIEGLFTTRRAPDRRDDAA